MGDADFGVDFKSDFVFIDGDLKLSKYGDNISQAICNRLNTVSDSLDLFYYDYGSLFTQFLGWKRTKETLNFMKVELDNVLKQDPRLNNFETSLNYNDEGAVIVNIVLEDTLKVDLILRDDGVKIIDME